MVNSMKTPEPAKIFLLLPVFMFGLIMSWREAHKTMRRGPKSS
jgi:hypothetical protein